MKLSIIIPAFNEEKYLGATLAAIDEALVAIDEAEVIVVDNDSTDMTREIAAARHARIINETEHNIARVRNAGAEAASGDLLVFIDADTLVSPGLFENILTAMADPNCLGGSVAVEYDRTYKRKWIKYYLMGWQFWGRVLKMQQGAAQFCRRDVFGEIGGYDPTIYMGEDIEFQWRLAKYARHAGSAALKKGPASGAPDVEQQPAMRPRAYTTFIDKPAVRTSSRRYEKMGLLRTLFLTHPMTILLTWRIRSLWKDWYENAIR